MGCDGKCDCGCDVKSLYEAELRNVQKHMDWAEKVLLPKVLKEIEDNSEDEMERVVKLNFLAEMLLSTGLATLRYRFGEKVYQEGIQVTMHTVSTNVERMIREFENNNDVGLN